MSEPEPQMSAARAAMMQSSTPAWLTSSKQSLTSFRTTKTANDLLSGGVAALGARLSRDASRGSRYQAKAADAPPAQCHLLQLLPDSLLLLVLSRAEPAALLALAGCGSARLRRLAAGEPLLWKALCCEEWGLS